MSGPFKDVRIVASGTRLSLKKNFLLAQCPEILIESEFSELHIDGYMGGGATGKGKFPLK
jgi:hypothetical protein